MRTACRSWFFLPHILTPEIRVWLSDLVPLPTELSDQPSENFFSLSKHVPVVFHLFYPVGSRAMQLWGDWSSGITVWMPLGCSPVDLLTLPDTLGFLFPL